MDEQFSLQWNDYQDSIRESWKDLRNERDFSDISLSSDDGSVFPAHKLILRSSSSYFKDVLQLYKKGKPLIHLRGTQKHVLEYILDFI